MGCKYRGDFMLREPVVKVFQHVSTLPAIGGIKVVRVDPQRYQIFLNSSMSLTSWGEKITLSFFDPLDGGTRVIAESQSALATTLIDYGKNRKNVEQIEQALRMMFPG